jgi:uncharacterized protein (TIGR02284 family)
MTLHGPGLAWAVFFFGTVTPAPRWFFERFEPMASRYADIPLLNHIATILVDARRLYHRAARLADEDRDVVNRIELTLGERSMLLTEIQNRMHALGAPPTANGSMLGAAHMAFLDVRSVFDRDVKSALAEVARGEKYLSDELRKAMRREDVSADTRAFLGIVLDRIVSGEMRIVGKGEEVEHRAH